MLVVFDNTKNMYNETLRIYKDCSELPKCSHCGGKLGYKESIDYISCNSVLPNGQRCHDRHGNDFRDNFQMTESEAEELKEFSEYCQSLKPFIKSHEHYKLNATMPIKYARAIKYAKGTASKVESIVKFCEKFNDGYPHLAKEVSLKMYNPELSNDEIRERMFELTEDESYLSEEAIDMFIF